jgi:hypothetical protein
MRKRLRVTTMLDAIPDRGETLIRAVFFTALDDGNIA